MFGRILASPILGFMCCWSSHQDDSDPEPATLRTLQPPSAVSIALPTSSVPHGARAGDEASAAQSLHQIFASSSSVRGYQAAAPVVPVNPPLSDRSTSFDANFRFVGQRSSERNLAGRLENLGHHIRQKLSESRLSKSSSKVALKQHDAGFKTLPSSGPSKKQDEQALLLLGTSHRSTGLSEILKSRTVSEGGYDSDAKSIETAMLWSNAGTIRVSPRFARQALHTAEIADEGAPKFDEAAKSDDEEKRQVTPSSHDLRAKSSPCPQTPPKINFTEALQIQNNESPTDVLRRISTGFVNGTIKLPRTPELQAMRMPSVVGGQKDWLLSFSAPRRASSLNKERGDVQDILKTLNQKVETAKRASIASNNNSEKHTSLVSDLDPTFVQYLSKYGGSPIPTHSAQVISDYVDTSAHNSVISLPRGNTHSARDRSLSDSDKDSIHLFNMRISQRLASDSLMPVISPSPSNIGSFTSQNFGSEQQDLSRGPQSFARFPSFITQEHNRRPSDPQTKRLFESGNTNSGLHPKWKAVASVNSLYPNARAARGVCDDSSSFYMSDAGLSSCNAGSLVHVTCKNSTKNPNSLAVAGRSISVALLGKHGSMSQPLNAERNLWLRRREPSDMQSSEDSYGFKPTDRIPGRERSVSMPKESSFVESFGTPTPKARKFRPSTEANEAMSEASSKAIDDRRNEALSELNAGDTFDRKSSNLSEIDLSTLQTHTSCGWNSQRTSAGWLSDGRRSGWGFDFVGQFPNGKIRVERKGGIGLRDIDDLGLNHGSATNMWECALRKAGNEALEGSGSSNGGLLGVPEFDHLGRRRTKTSSSGDPSRERSPERRDTMDTGRSRSENGESSFSLEQHQRLCSIARAPLSRAESGRPLSIDGGAKTVKERGEEKPRKKSLLDIRRFTTIGFPQEKDGEGPQTPIKDFLSTWARFPSHNKEERNGTAGDNDRVKVRDFSPPADEDDGGMAESKMAFFSTPQASRSVANLGLHTLGSWRSLALSKNPKYNTHFQKRGFSKKNGTATARKRTSLLHNFRRLYRSRSSEWRNYAFDYGHRSTISMGGTVEYPELEIIPGESLMGVMWKGDQERALMQTNEKKSGNSCGSPQTMVFQSSDIGNDEAHMKQSTRNEGSAGAKRQAMPIGQQSKFEAATKREERRPYASNPKAHAEAWGEMYKDCVVSHGKSERKKEADNQRPSEPECHHRKESTELRASTVNFGKQLQDEMTRTSKELMRKAERLGAGGHEEVKDAGSLKLPPKITDCDLGLALGKKGSCEDVGNGVVNGA